MTRQEHTARHVLLHQMFDELLADFIRHHSDRLATDVLCLDRPIRELMQWSHQQTIEAEDSSFRHFGGT